MSRLLTIRNWNPLWSKVTGIIGTIGRGIGELFREIGMVNSTFERQDDGHRDSP